MYWGVYLREDGIFEINEEPSEVPVGEIYEESYANLAAAAPILIEALQEIIKNTDNITIKGIALAAIDVASGGLRVD